MPVTNVKVKDLAKEAFNLFRAKALKSRRVSENVLMENNEILLEKLQLKDGDYLKRATVLLFHPDPEIFFSGAYIKIGFFQTDAELIYQDEIHGNLFEQSEKAIELLLTTYLKAYISYEGITRVEHFLFPREALRESLLNAIVHKDYSCGVPIQIKVYEDKIIFWNEGYLPENWTIENLKQQHPSKPYNPDIANAFFRAGFIESWGRGIEKMGYECRNHGIPKPKLKYIPSNFMLEFNANKLMKNVMKRATSNIKKDDSKQISSVKSSVKIIELMRKNSHITIPELAKELGLTTRAIEKQIAKAQEKGKINRIGPAKGGHWTIIE